MKNIHKDIINIIKAAITDTKYELSDDFDFDKAFSIAKNHGIIVILYYGLLNCNVDSNSPMMQQLFMLACQYIAVSERQLYALNEIYKKFDTAEIEYMPLKGTLLKELYKKPEMRSMGDADILIKLSQYESIKPIMTELNYIESVESDPEIVWKKSGSYIELHKGLVSPSNKDYYNYYGDGWKVAKIKTGTRYSMTDEDQMIYLFIHFSKHYRNGGIGIRHFVDLWVYKNSKKNLNEIYIKTELKKLRLYEFYVNVFRTLGVWFENEEFDEMTVFITKSIFNSGNFGTLDNTFLSNTLKESKKNGSISGAKRQSIILSIFLPYKGMCIKYPFLKKVPVLLPVMWIVRCFDFVFRKRNFKHYIYKYSTITEDSVSNYEKALKYVGLDFDFLGNKE